MGPDKGGADFGAVHQRDSSTLCRSSGGITGCETSWSAKIDYAGGSIDRIRSRVRARAYMMVVSAIQRKDHAQLQNNLAFPPIKVAAPSGSDCIGDTDHGEHTKRLDHAASHKLTARSYDKSLAAEIDASSASWAGDEMLAV